MIHGAVKGFILVALDNLFMPSACSYSDKLLLKVIPPVNYQLIGFEKLLMTSQVR
jgi:hypothetical protein